MKQLALILFLVHFIGFSQSPDLPSYPKDGGYFPEMDWSKVKSFQVFEYRYNGYEPADTICRYEMHFNEDGYMTKQIEYPKTYPITKKYIYNEKGYLVDVVTESPIRGPIANPAPGVLDGVYWDTLEMKIEETWVGTRYGNKIQSRKVTKGGKRYSEETYAYDENGWLISAHTIYEWHDQIYDFTISFDYEENGLMTKKVYCDIPADECHAELIIVYEYWE